MSERRLQKAASVIGDFVSSLFVTRVSDPRLRPISVTRAKVSADMRKAYIYYSVMGGDEEREAAEKALLKAKGFVRASLGSGLSLRHTPEVSFIFDRNPAYAQKVMEILGSDPSVAALRAGASAGEAPAEACLAAAGNAGESGSGGRPAGAGRAEGQAPGGGEAGGSLSGADISGSGGSPETPAPPGAGGSPETPAPPGAGGSP
ncbi:MAG: 30S ribosome-binding factor RbfA, partial [Deltaproteobacteria bacterium]|nr:30S ribosome-binding factor RbfA [Deltaproteobacteria bacterium]